jgi:hypothetical protein
MERDRSNTLGKLQSRPGPRLDRAPVKAVLIFSFPRLVDRRISYNSLHLTILMAAEVSIGCECL